MVSGPSDDPAGGAGDEGEIVAAEFEALYDDATLAAIEAWAQARVAGASRTVPGDGPDAVDLEPPGRRDPRTMGTGGAMLAAALFGLADALRVEPPKPDVVEYAPDDAAPGERAATFVFVPGFPEACRIEVRPWLLGDDARLAAPGPHVAEAAEGEGPPG